ncbi:putative nucleotidyltransferase, ribonuclease H [Tanacetum coccineum]|uniref:Nucleotidyltransferase, ribonuclease H n=1 Tax=Tanacetum coccineum TaxID=301880 RepID=A0ABQ5B9S9_9ASTR
MKSSSHFMERNIEKSDHVKKVKWVDGVLLVEDQIRNLQEKVYAGSHEPDLRVLKSDLEVLFNTVHDLKKETVKPESMLPSSELPSPPRKAFLSELDVTKSENENQNMKNGKQEEFRVDEHGVIWYGNRLCVPGDSSLQEAILTGAHSSPFFIHPGSTKMYRDLKQKFWWNGMKQEVARFVAKCLTCQQVKIEHQRASGLLQPLDIPTWKWEQISMDFLTRLPRTFKKNDAIWVVVDRLTKSAHFLPIQQGYSSSKLAEIFPQEIIRLHGTPASIVSDRNPRFTSRFWKGLQNAWGARLKFSTAFHPQTDGQTERTIQTLEDMLRSCALEWTGNWDEYLCLVEFAYNNSWHASIKGAPFELLYGRKCRALICWNEVGERVIEGPELVEVTNEKVAITKEKLKEARSSSKSLGI